ncbi:hypothetical protein F4777DRAFT_559104 [Nemania sp. FL0916]|nr:hypothetical protein F4777DRAFT_559104 [Nemania sp. FL0916]
MLLSRFYYSATWRWAASLSMPLVEGRSYQQQPRTQPAHSEQGTITQYAIGRGRLDAPFANPTPPASPTSP